MELYDILLAEPEDRSARRTRNSEGRIVILPPAGTGDVWIGGESHHGHVGK